MRSPLRQDVDGKLREEGFARAPKSLYGSAKFPVPNSLDMTIFGKRSLKNRKKSYLNAHNF